jgi:recombination protein RecT
MAQPPSNKLAPVDEFRMVLAKMQPQFQMVLPPHIPPERFVRVVFTAVQNNPKLLELNRATLFSSAMRAATDGLLPDGREGAIVPFGNDATWMPMVGGILKKVRNSGELASITAQIVHKADKFRYWIDSDGQHIEHEPLLFGERGEILGVYALAKTKDDAIYIEAMTKAEVEKVRAVSPSRGSGPWVNWWEEMAKKTVIRRLSKRLPMSTDKDQEAIQRVIESNDEEPAATENSTPAAAPVVVEDAAPKKKSRLAKLVEDAAPVASAAPPAPAVDVSPPRPDEIQQPEMKQ